MQLIIFFISPTLALCEPAQIVSLSSMLTETNNFKEGGFASFRSKAAEGEHAHCIFKRSMQLIIFFIFSLYVLCKSALTVSASSIIAETDNFKEEDIAFFGVKLQRRRACSLYIQGINAIMFFS
jgi:hypothetical protein